MKLSLRYFLFSAILLLQLKIFCQPSFHYLEKLSASEGLSSNAVNDLVQDGNGYLWIGTSYGLNRYDGTEIIHYYTDKGKNSLPDNKINDLELLDSFHIAIATNYGLSILDTRNNKFKNFFFTRSGTSETFDNYVKIVHKDAMGYLWIISLDCLFRMGKDLQSVELISAPFSEKDFEKFRIEYIHKVIELESGKLLFWTDAGILVWDTKSSGLQQLDLSLNSPWKFLRNVNPGECFKVSGHYLIVVHKKELLLFDEYTQRVSTTGLTPDYIESIDFAQQISTLENGWLAFSYEKRGVSFINISEKNFKICFYHKVYFADQNFRKWFKDSEGNWWVTTEVDGLIKFSPDKQLFEEREIRDPQTNKKSDFDISCFFKYKGNWIIGTYGDGIFEMDSGTGHIVQHIVNNQKPYNNLIWNFQLREGNILWVGTGSGLEVFDLEKRKFSSLTIPHPPELDSFAITCQFADSRGTIWMGIGAGHGLCTFNPENNTFKYYPYQSGSYPFRYPLSIAEDSSGNLWFISDNTHDLVKWNHNANQFVIISVPLRSNKKAFSTGSFFMDKKDIIWYGIESEGLVSFDTHTGSNEIFDIDKGLNTDVINNITEDKSGRLWLATRQGLSIFSKTSRQFVNLTEMDGLPASSCTSSFYYDDETGKMFTASRGNVIEFRPVDFVEKSTPMNVLVTRVLINNKNYHFSPGSVIELPANENDITINFTGINLTNGGQNRYSYQMGNGQTGWKDIGSQRQLSFASLKPGRYNFAIRAARKNGIWNQDKENIIFVIKPPFTSTIWFYLIVMSIISLGFYGWYRFRLGEIKRLELVREGISHDLHDDIGSRLTNISLMSIVAKQHLANEYKTLPWLDKIREESQSLSQSIREIVWNINPVNDDLNEAFPRMLRYTTETLEANGISVKADINELHGTKLNMKKRRDLFLIFKEAIQNILKHAEATHVNINFFKSNGCLFLEIQDNGNGFDTEIVPIKNGLDYMKHRAESNHWKFRVESEKGNGTKLFLDIKIN